MEMTVEFTVLLDLLSGPAITVKGAQPGDTINFTVLDELGQPFLSDLGADIADQTAIVAQAIASGLGVDAYPATSTIAPQSAQALTLFTVTAANADQPALGTLTTGILKLVPSVTYSGTVTDDATPTPAPVVGAVASTTYLTNEAGAPYTFTSDDLGAFNITMPKGSFEMEATHPDFIPATFDAATELADNSLTLLSPQATATITVNNLLAGNMVSVTAQYLEGETLISTAAQKLFAGGTGTDIVSLRLAARDYESITVASEDFVTVSFTDGYPAASLNTLALTADMAFEPIFGATTLTPPGGGLGPTLTIGLDQLDPTDGTTLVPQDISNFDAVTFDESGASTDINQAANGSDANNLNVDVPTNDETIVALISDVTDLVTYAFTYHPTAVAPNRPTGTRQVDAQAGGTFTFTPSLVQEDTVLTQVVVTLHAGGMDTSSLGCSSPMATLEVNTLDLSGAASAIVAQATATEDLIVEVNLHMDDCSASSPRLIDTSEESLDDVMREIYITLPFDVTAVNEGDFESGAIKVYQAGSRSSFIDGLAQPFSPTEVINADYANGFVTFRATHLSAFSIGPGEIHIPSEPFVKQDNHDFGCFIKALGADL
jgi:hypothetical protein